MKYEYADSEYMVPNTEEEIDRYRCWFDYLKQTNPSDWSERVRADFGDIHQATFKEWWPAHIHLFIKLPPLKIRELKSLDDYSPYYDDGSIQDRSIAVIPIDMCQSKKDIKAAFTEWLKRAHPGQRGAPLYTDELALFYPIGYTNVRMLDKALKVYRALVTERTKPKNQQRPYHRLEEELNLIDKQEWKRPWTDRERAAQTEAISDYHRIAKEVLANVVNGEFPVYTKQEKKKS